MLRRRLLPLVAVVLVSCAENPTPIEPGHDVAVVVFLDEDGDGRLGPQEAGRVPGVDVEVLGTDRTARSEAGTGRGLLTTVPAGSHSLLARWASLPAFHRADRGVLFAVPGTDTVAMPVTLPIGRNLPHTYMAFGDSITVGVGSSDGNGYRRLLEARLASHFGRAQVLDEGVSGTTSLRGAARIVDSLARRTPAYTLVHYGTNDWNKDECELDETCFTIDSLREIVRQVRAARSLPVLATIIPANPDHEKSPPERNQWIARMNARIRSLARDEVALLADLHASFESAGNLPGLFADHVHPNDRGYALMAQDLFRAITMPRPPHL